MPPATKPKQSARRKPKAAPVAAVPDPEPTRFRVDGKEFEVVDLDDLEFGEIELIEDAFGCSAEDIDFRRAKAIRWLVFIAMRRAGEPVEFEQLGELKFSAITEAVDQNGDGAGRPTPADGD